MIQSENTPEKEQQLTWTEWQLRNKYIWIALAFLTAGSICAYIGEDAGGWTSFTVILLVTIYFPIYRGMIKLWNEYKAGKTS